MHTTKMKTNLKSFFGNTLVAESSATKSYRSLSLEQSPCKGKQILLALTTLVVFDTLHAKSPPEPLTAGEIEALYSAAEGALNDQNLGNSAKERAERFLMNQIAARTLAYEGAVMSVEASGSTGISTKINFSEERMDFRFSVKPPQPGMQLIRYDIKPIIKIRRGNKNRVLSHRVRPGDINNNIVNYRITLIEPNATERNVSIDYRASAYYEFRGASSISAAERDLERLHAHIDKIIITPESINDSTRRTNAINAADDLKAARAQDKKPDSSKISQIIPYRRGISPGDAIAAALLTSLGAFVTGVCVHRINRIGDSYFSRRSSSKRKKRP